MDVHGKYLFVIYLIIRIKCLFGHYLIHENIVRPHLVRSSCCLTSSMWSGRARARRRTTSSWAPSRSTPRSGSAAPPSQAASPPSSPRATRWQSSSSQTPRPGRLASKSGSSPQDNLGDLESSPPPFRILSVKSNSTITIVQRKPKNYI